MKSLVFILISVLSNTIKTDKILCINNRNITLKTGKPERVWSFKDLNSEKIIDTNRTMYSLIPFNFEDAGREIYLSEVGTNKILKTFHLIGIEDRCNVEILKKDQDVTLICSIKVKKQIGNGIIEDPIMNWFYNKNESFKEISLNTTKNKMEIFDSNKNILKYSSETTLKIPSNDELIWELNNKEIYCEITHETSSIINSTEVKIDTIAMSSIYCNNHLNINFNPFISEISNRTQLLNENQLSYIECPIKAPNFKPYKYLINWYFRSSEFELNPDLSNFTTWLFKYTKTFDNSGDLFIISNAKHGIDDGIYKCELIENLSGSVILSEIIIVKFNQIPPKSKQTNMLNTEFNKFLIYAILALFIALIIIILALIKFKTDNKKAMRVTVNQDQQLTDTATFNYNHANLKYEKTNLQSNKLYNDNDDQVYQENSYVDDQSTMKKLASFDTKSYIVHLANKLKHKKSCPMYNKNQISFTETSLSSFKTISNRSDSTLKPIFQKNVQFNLKDSESNGYYDDSDCMESIYIHGFNVPNVKTN